MNKEFKELFRKSGLTKYAFAKKIGMPRQNINLYLHDKHEMKVSHFERIKTKFYE